MEDLRKVEEFEKVVRKQQKVVRKFEQVGRKPYICSVNSSDYDQEGSTDSPD
jgi:hypothetical protein